MRRAESLFSKELDVFNILRKLRDAHNFRSLFLTDRQQILLKLTASNIVEVSESSDSSKDYHRRNHHGYDDIIEKYVKNLV